MRQVERIEQGWRHRHGAVDAAADVLQALRASPPGMVGGGEPLPEELTRQADRALREAGGGSDHHRADDLGIAFEHVGRLRQAAEVELGSIDTALAQAAE